MTALLLRSGESRDDGGAEGALRDEEAPPTNKRYVLVLAGRDGKHRFLILAPCVEIGRTADNDVSIDHTAIDAHHVRVCADARGGHYVTTGTSGFSVAGAPAREAQLGFGVPVALPAGFELWVEPYHEP